MNAPRKKTKKKGIVEVEALEVEIIRPNLKEKFQFSPENLKKEVILTKIPLPEGHVRCMVLQGYQGMEDNLYPGDVVDLPERRYKSLSFRGVVNKYDGELQPNRRR